MTPEQYNEWDEVIHHDAIPDNPDTPDVDESQPAYDDIIHHKEKIADAVYKDVWVDDVWHYEYESGWRDGDFKYKGD